LPALTLHSRAGAGPAGVVTPAPRMNVSCREECSSNELPFVGATISAHLPRFAIISFNVPLPSWCHPTLDHAGQAPRRASAEDDGGAAGVARANAYTGNRPHAVSNHARAVGHRSLCLLSLFTHARGPGPLVSPRVPVSARFRRRLHLRSSDFFPLHALAFLCWGVGGVRLRRASIYPIL
jgi:hypothetical protein